MLGTQMAVQPQCGWNHQVYLLVEHFGTRFHRISVTSLESKTIGLRKRMQNLFLEFLQNPEYNPRAKDFIPLYGGGEGAGDRDKGAVEEKEKW